jgi:hypothetical protein
MWFVAAAPSVMLQIAGAVLVFIGGVMVACTRIS